MLATLGFVGFIPGVFALVLAQREISAIERLEAPAAGESFARMARTIGWFHVLMLLMIAIAIVSRLTHTK